MSEETNISTIKRLLEEGRVSIAARTPSQARLRFVDDAFRDVPDDD